MTTCLRAPLLAGLALPLVLAAPSLSHASDGLTNRVSLQTGGAQANGPNEAAVITPDGTWVAFSSDATNLVVGDTNGFKDVFVHNRFTKNTVRVSVGRRGAQANGDSARRGPDYESGKPIAITPDGRFVAFHSDADNLSGGDINSGYDIFVHDRDPDADGLYDEANAITELISVTSDEVQPNPLPYHCSSPTISDDGRYVAFQSTGRLDPSLFGGYTQIFVRDRLAGLTTMISLTPSGTAGLGDSTAPAISGNGRHVAFQSKATGLVPDDSSVVLDTFVRDLVTSATTRVSVRTGGLEANGPSQNPRISYEGRWVVFHSGASNLVPGDTNQKDDAFLHDRTLGVTSLVSRTPGGAPGGDWSRHPDISPDGRWIVFESIANDLVAEDTGYYRDIFRFDRTKKAMRWVSRARTGWIDGFATGQSRWPSVDASGSRIAFESDAYNLIWGDSNQATDIFVRTVMPGWIAPWH